MQIGDITTQEIPNLPKDITSSNFGKMNKEASSCDILLGISNLVFETVGVMAAFLCKNDNVKDIIIIGGMAKHPYLKITWCKLYYSRKSRVYMCTRSNKKLLLFTK